MKLENPNNRSRVLYDFLLCISLLPLTKIPESNFHDQLEELIKSLPEEFHKILLDKLKIFHLVSMGQRDSSLAIREMRELEGGNAQMVGYIRILETLSLMLDEWHHKQSQMGSQS